MDPLLLCWYVWGSAGNFRAAPCREPIGCESTEITKSAGRKGTKEENISKRVLKPDIEQEEAGGWSSDSQSHK